MKKIFFLSIAFISCFAGCVINNDRFGPEIIKFRASLGTVTFTHGRHEEYFKDDCSICHHKTDNGVQNCHGCHKKKIDTEENDPPSFFDVKINLCRECHKKRREENPEASPPVDCIECHNVKELRGR